MITNGETSDAGHLKRKSTAKHVFQNQGPVTQVELAGDITNITHNYEPANVPSTSKLRPIRFQYQPPVEDFIGRQEELGFLKEKLCIENPRVMVVSGLGGIGKTQLVKQFIKESKEFYRNVVWINSQGKESVEKEFKTLAESELDLSLNVNGKERDFRTIIHMVFDRLSTSKTMLVFDNVDQADTAKIVLDVVAVEVKPHILITSRIQEFSESVNVRKLNVFSSEVALEYISTKLDNETLEDKMVLAATLNNLPLALRQATAHIKYHRNQDGKYAICKYIADFNQYREQMLSSVHFQKDIFHQYKETTLTTWQMTMNAIRKCEPDGELALRILHIMAYFDNAQIMRKIFFNLEGLADEPQRKETQVTSAVRLIINYSMVDDYKCQSVLGIHKLVQEVIQIQLENEERSESTLRDGLRLISQIEENEKLKRCLDHAISVYRSALRFRELVIEFDVYPSMILKKLLKSGNYLRGFSFGTEINEQFTAIVGNDHPSTIVLHFNIARIYSYLCKYTEALRMFEEVLAKQKMVLGTDHPDTFRTEHNIACSYNKLGKHSEALPMLEEVLAKQKMVLGTDHPDTIRTEYNIACSYNKLGKPSEALRMFEELLAKRKIVLGTDHPDTISTEHNNAESYSNLGKHSEALRMLEDVLAKQKIVLGTDHPDTIHTKHIIACSYNKLGKHSEALPMFGELLSKRKIVLRKDHPHTFRTEHHIACSYNKLGKHSEAIRMYEEVFAKQKMVLGTDHPGTIRTEHNIAESYSNLGNHSEALRMYEEVFAKQKMVLGKDHPRTFRTERNIACSYNKLGKHSEALRMFGELLSKRKIVLRKDHPDTIHIEHNIAESYSNLGKHSEALRMLEDVLAKQKMVLGTDHPDTIRTERNIACSYNKLGKHSEALRMLEDVLAKQKMVLGTDHPDTIRTKSNMADSSMKLLKEAPDRVPDF
ncbi:uncharacterized protein LOC119083825 isoform X2 [Bradysia coprophila]|uniref:uncharacterized protein LOC119083825 isoform X2 n=1 Tax=Bradysia coprophila TaxID=38358 RepID=UPI00187DCE51|nr:uncharacterized protein LOC119083825 isoform X2 [Bradysia coprophila]